MILTKFIKIVQRKKEKLLKIVSSGFIFLKDFVKNYQEEIILFISVFLASLFSFFLGYIVGKY